MTPEAERSIRIKVGIFTLVGLLLMAGMVTYFGRLGEGLQRFYQIRVEYPNASGLIQGADVLMAGAKIGQVADGPNILPDGRGVYVLLKIRDGIEIPQNSVFTIGSSGLLGDRFVDITMPLEGESAPPILPGGSVQGRREGGISELADQGSQLVAEVRTAVQRINRVAERVDEELLSRETIKNFSETLASLRTTTAELSTASQRLDGMLSDSAQKLEALLDKAGVAADEGAKTMRAASAAAREIEKTAADFRNLAQDARKAQGLLGVLLYDRQTADNVRALIANLRARGILFYRDRPETADR